MNNNGKECDVWRGRGLLLWPTDLLSTDPHSFFLLHTMWKQSCKTSAAEALGHKPHACEGRADSHKPSTPFVLALPHYTHLHSGDCEQLPHCLPASRFAKIQHLVSMLLPTQSWQDQWTRKMEQSQLTRHRFPKSQHANSQAKPQLASSPILM